MHPGFFLPPSEPQSVSPLIWVARISTLFSISVHFQWALPSNLSSAQKKAHIPNKDIVHFILLIRLRQDCLSRGHCKIKRGLVHKYILGVRALHCALCTAGFSSVAETRRPCCKAAPPSPRGEEKSLEMAFSDVGHSWQLLQIIHMSYTCSSVVPVWPRGDIMRKKTFFLPGIASIQL